MSNINLTSEVVCAHFFTQKSALKIWRLLRPRGVIRVKIVSQIEIWLGNIKNKKGHVGAPAIQPSTRAIVAGVWL